jgi:hypothetical protein
VAAAAASARTRLRRRYFFRFDGIPNHEGNGGGDVLSVDVEVQNARVVHAMTFYLVFFLAAVWDVECDFSHLLILRPVSISPRRVTSFPLYPALKRWAKLGRPCGAWAFVAGGGAEFLINAGFA